MVNPFKRLYFHILYKFTEPEMVQYWKHGEAQRARIFNDKDGSTKMEILGEKYPFPGYPRGHLLFGSLSPLKHQIKNQIFNDTWAMLEKGKDSKEITKVLRETSWPNIKKMIDRARFDMVPPEKLSFAVKEIYRAFTVLYERHQSENILYMRDAMTFILQEDDGYRFRVQWCAGLIPRWAKMKHFLYACTFLEHAEIVGDMKERIRLLRRVLKTIVEDPRMCQLAEEFMREVDWKKVKLSKADKYYFRAKYFKVDYPYYQY